MYVCNSMDYINMYVLTQWIILICTNSMDYINMYVLTQWIILICMY